MDISKSTRHQKIIGSFGEILVCNWLSRSGFEVTVVDHTGLDVVAYDPATGQRLGITVKSRTRSVGTEKESVNVLSYRKGKDDRKTLLAACKAFACEPWLAVYVETAASADLYLTSLKHYDAVYRLNPDKVIDDWKMTPKSKEQYRQDPEVKHLHACFEAAHWWGEGES